MRKTYILADMEGVSGIRRYEQMQRDSPDYPECRELMMGDINAAIDAAYEAGADEVVACDTHAGGGQVRVGEMDERAVYETPGGGRMMPSLDESFAGLVLLGHHAMAGTVDGFLDHTMSSRSWFEYRINGRAVGEIGIEAAWAAHYGVPVIAVSGDDATRREATELLGPVECAVVKWGIGRNRARCLSIPTARERIKTAVKTAMAEPGKYLPWKPSLPATVRLTLCRTDMADDKTAGQGVRRVDARTVEKTVDSLLQIGGW